MAYRQNTRVHRGDLEVGGGLVLSQTPDGRPLLVGREGYYPAASFRVSGDGADWSLAVWRASQQARADKLAGLITGGVVELPPFAIEFHSRVPLTWQTLGVVQGLESVRFVGNGADQSLLVPVGSRTSLFSGFMEPDEAPFYAGAWLARDIGFEGMAFDMDYLSVADGGATNPTYGTTHVYAADNYQYPIFLYYVKGAKIVHCKFAECWYNAIELYTVENALVDDCDFAHVGDVPNYIGLYACVEPDGRSWDVQITRNRMRSVGNCMVANGDNANAHPDGRPSGGKILYQANRASEIKLSAIQAFDNWDGVTIDQSDFDQIVSTAISIEFRQSAVNNAKGPRNVRVTRCNVTDFNTTALTGVGAIDVTAVRPYIYDNFCQNSLGPSADSYYGILVRKYVALESGSPVEYTGASIINNRFDGSFAQVPVIYSLAEDTIATGNSGYDVSGTGGSISAQAARSFERDNNIANALRLDDARGAVRVEAVAFPGDANVTHRPGEDPTTYIFGALTNHRNVTLNGVGAKRGDRVRITQTAETPWTVNIGGGTVVLNPNTRCWVDFEFSGPPGNTWRLAAYGPLDNDRIKVSGTNGVTGLYVQGQLAIRELHANIPGPTGGATVDSQARTAINAILNMVSSHHKLMSP